MKATYERMEEHDDYQVKVDGDVIEFFMGKQSAKELSESLNVLFGKYENQCQEAFDFGLAEGKKEGLKTLAQAMAKIGFCEQCQTIIEIIKKLPDEKEPTE